MKDQLQHILFHIKENEVNGDSRLILLDDESIISVLEVTPLPFYELKKQRQDEITEKFNELFLSLDFAIDIVIKPVNNGAEKRFAIMEKLLTYNINQTEKTPLIEFNEKFFKWINAFIKKDIKEAYTYFIVIKTSPSTGKEGSLKRASEIISQRTSYVIEHIRKTGVKTKQLTSEDLTVLYTSYIKPYLYKDGTYLFPNDWVELFKKEKGNE